MTQRPDCGRVGVAALYDLFIPALYEAPYENVAYRLQFNTPHGPVQVNDYPTFELQLAEDAQRPRAAQQLHRQALFMGHPCLDVVCGLDTNVATYIFAIPEHLRPSSAVGRLALRNMPADWSASDPGAWRIATNPVTRATLAMPVTQPFNDLRLAAVFDLLSGQR